LTIPEHELNALLLREFFVGSGGGTEALGDGSHGLFN